MITKLEKEFMENVTEEIRDLISGLSYNQEYDEENYINDDKYIFSLINSILNNAVKRGICFESLQNMFFSLGNDKDLPTSELFYHLYNVYDYTNEKMFRFGLKWSSLTKKPFYMDIGENDEDYTTYAIGSKLILLQDLAELYSCYGLTNGFSISGHDGIAVAYSINYTVDGPEYILYNEEQMLAICNQK